MFLIIGCTNNLKGEKNMEDENKIIKVYNFDVEYKESGQKLTVDNFLELEFGISLNEVEKKIGEPNGWIGAGILAPYYSVDDGKYAILRFKNPITYENLQRIELVNDSKVLEEIVLEDQ